jgi:hypothetical protein
MIGRFRRFALDIQHRRAGAVDVIMLTWNPEVWDAWDPPYEQAVAATSRGDVAPSRWSVANRVNIPIGSDAWFLLQGKERGLLGHGVVTSEPFPDRHYADPSRRSHYVIVGFDRLLNREDRIPIEVLKTEASSVKWNSFRSSGMSISPEGARELERVWERHAR